MCVKRPPRFFERGFENWGKTSQFGVGDFTPHMLHPRETQQKNHGEKFCPLALSEAFGLHSKALNHIQVFGASLTVLGGVFYGRSRQAIELEVEERKALLPGK